jgi:thioredoxin 1
MVNFRIYAQSLIFKQIALHIKRIHMEHLTKTTFREKIFDYELSEEWSFSGERPAIIDFYADWCGPCKMIAPILDEIANEYDGKIDIYKVNTDRESDLAADFGISSIPTILFIPKEGQPRAVQGAMPKTSFHEIITDVLKVS